MGKRWNISYKLTQNPIVVIPNEIIPTDGKNLRYRQLESIAKTFGIHNAILPRAEIGGDIQEMVDKGIILRMAIKLQKKWDVKFLLMIYNVN